MLNKLCLGTVQLGLPYGVNNKVGKPTKEESEAILDTAYRAGIRIFDTAAAYGNAEEIIGDWIRTRNLQKQVKIISKLRPNILEDDHFPIPEVIRREVEKSLEQLNIGKLEGYLLHTPSYFYNKAVIEGLEQVKAIGLVENIGVSIYETQEALDVAASERIDYIQIPYNILDQRLDRTEFFSLTKKNRIKVFARSPFLQGLLFMEPEEARLKNERSEKYLTQMRKIIIDHNEKIANIALKFSHQHAGIDYIVFGVDNSVQLEENVLISKKVEVNAKCLEELKERFAYIEKEVIFPSLWAKKKGVE